MYNIKIQEYKECVAVLNILTMLYNDEIEDEFHFIMRCASNQTTHAITYSKVIHMPGYQVLLNVIMGRY